MKFRFAALAALPLLVTIATAQTPNFQPPKIQSGLWQSKVTTTTTGMGEDKPETTVQQSCITPQSMKKDMQNFGLQGNEASHCTATGVHQDAHQATYDESCELANHFKTHIQFHMIFDSPERVHATATVMTSGPGMPKGMAMNIKIESHYLKSDCGSLQPGEDKTIEQ